MIWRLTLTLAQAGVTHCFVNLGSDHPSIMEAIVKGQRERPESFPRIVTCPNEMVRVVRWSHIHESSDDEYTRLRCQWRTDSQE